MQQNFIDRAASFVSPKWGAARMAARAHISRALRVKALYEGASLSRRTSGWRAVGTDANAETRLALGRLRDVSRDMVRNNAFAARAKATISHNVVGSGILPSVKSGSDARAKQVKDLIARHLETTDIDADGRLNFYGLQALAMSTIVEAGEVLIRMRPRRSEDKFALPFQLQILEPDFLDTSVDGMQSNGNLAIQGVEFSALGRRIAYYIFDQHPGSTSPNASMRTRGIRVSADYVAHIFRADRPGQVRGVSWFAPVLLRMRDFADHVDAKLMQQKIAACFGAFITSETPEDTSNLPEPGVDGYQASGSDYPAESFEPGMIERLKVGEEVSFATPPSTEGFDAYSKVTLREIAAGLNVTYEALTGDLTGVNYSSGRMGWLEYQRSIDGWRWNMLIPQMMDPVENWIQQAVAVATGSTEPFKLAWTPPRREMIDPDTELKAASTSIRTGLSSRSQELRRLGLEPQDIDEEIAADNARADKLGLVFDSDPRKITANGMKQSDAKAGAAIPAN
jgi:lambda family phage portal protein